jgi:nucleotide-binding universal stress UspA family protein
MFKRILVPIDGSHTAGLGLDEAIKLAKNQNTSLYLFHVVDEVSILQSADVSGWMNTEGLMAAVRRDGETLLANAEAKVRRHGVKVKSLLIERISGIVADLIVKQAKQCKADLIVLGTHGRRGIRRVVMGSDAERVVQSTTVPVLLVRSAAGTPRKMKKSRTK